MINLEMQPATPPMSREAFCAQAGPFSIAIDGFVGEGPWFDGRLPAKNLNHHEGVSRLETRATCAQALMAVRSGLFKRFRDQDGPRATVYANDCDEDVCLTWFVLKHHVLANQTMNQLLNRLVGMVDILDTTAGAYPFPEDLTSLQTMAWIFEPYRRFRLAGGLATRDAGMFASIVTDVEQRVLAYLNGSGKTLPLDTKYCITSQHPNWSHVVEIGAQARIGMYSDGIRAFLSTSLRPDGKWSYVVGRMSEYIDFPIPEILQALNEAEGLVFAPDRWGGGTTIGGSPRIAGSSLSPDQVEQVIHQRLMVATLA